MLEDKDRLKIDIRVAYGKNELQPEEINWLKEFSFVRTSFCKNFHEKSHLNEESCIIASLNLYEFSQINNNEMGIFVDRKEDSQLYNEAYEEAQRIIRISDEIRISLEKVSSAEEKIKLVKHLESEKLKLIISKLAKKNGLKTSELLNKFIENGYLEIKEEKHSLTDLWGSWVGNLNLGDMGHILFGQTI